MKPKTKLDGRGRRNKGKSGERELSGVIAEVGGWPARRGQQRSGVDSADVIDGPPGWHFECKRVEKLNVWAAYRQAEQEREPGEVPVVAMRRNHSPWLAVLDLRTLLRLVKQAADAPLAALAPPPSDDRPSRRSPQPRRRSKAPTPAQTSLEYLLS